MHAPDRRKGTITQLNLQRKRLGMSYAALAKQSGVSVPTVTRILSGAPSSAHFDHVLAIAAALGLGIETRIETPARDLRARRARHKAARLVNLVQGTSALEAQAVDDDALRDMVERTVHELLAGPARNLWAD
jgi:transcriptional regulator with XRE-family HTH domain